MYPASAETSEKDRRKKESESQSSTEELLTKLSPCQLCSSVSRRRISLDTTLKIFRIEDYLIPRFFSVRRVEGRAKHDTIRFGSDCGDYSILSNRLQF